MENRWKNKNQSISEGCYAQAMLLHDEYYKEGMAVWNMSFSELVEAGLKERALLKFEVLRLREEKNGN